MRLIIEVFLRKEIFQIKNKNDVSMLFLSMYLNAMSIHSDIISISLTYISQHKVS